MRTMWLAMLVAIAAPVAAHAQDGEKLDCAIANSTAEFRSELGSAMAGRGSDGERDTLFKKLGDIVTNCSVSAGYDTQQDSDYYDYALARISREWMAVEITGLGLSPEVVETALDFGPGKTNPDLSDDMTQEEIAAIINGYEAVGVNIDGTPQESWTLVGSYAAASSIYWRKRALFVGAGASG